MSFDSNAWYTIQNFGNDWFLGCQNVGLCGTAELGLADAELFQLARINGSQTFYVRPKAQKASSIGEAYCVNINTGQPTVVTCDAQSASWGIGSWSGGDGRFFFSTQTGDSQRLSLSNNQSYSLVSYDGLSESNQVLMQWGISSRAPINDQSYSTVPAAVTRNAAITTTPFPNTTSTSTTSASSGSSSGPAQSPSTMTMVVTPTVTASQVSAGGASRTSSPTVSATLASGADRPRLGTKSVLTMILILPQVLLSFC